MIVPRVTLIGDPAAAALWVGVAKKLALECYRLHISSKTYRPDSETLVLVENIFPVFAKQEGICKVQIQAGAQDFYYQFITTSSTIETDTNGYYMGSAVAVSLPTDVTKFSTKTLKGVATGSTLESRGNPPKLPTTDINKITKIRNVNQVQLIPENIYYGYYVDSTNNYKLHSQLAYASVCPQGCIYNAGLYMLSDTFSSTDIGYDLAPTVLKRGNPIGRTPDSDWVNEACRARVASEEYGVRYFIVMADASGKFYCWPDQYDSNDILDPPDPSYTAQQYKATVPDTQVVSVMPPFPDWVYVPQGQRRDTDWPASVNSGEPRYGWRFHPLGTKVVGTVLKRTEFTGEVCATRSTIGSYAGNWTCTPSTTITFLGVPRALVSIHNWPTSITFNVYPDSKFDLHNGEPIYLDCVIDIYEDAPGYPEELHPIQIYGEISGDYSYDTYGLIGIRTETISISITNAPFWLNAGSSGVWSTYNELYRFSLGDAQIIPQIKDDRCGQIPSNLLFDAPGIVEFIIDISINGPNKEDFDFSMSLARSQEPDDDHYYIAAGYLSPFLNTAIPYPENTTPGDLLVAKLDCYYIESEIEDEVARRIGYCGSLRYLLNKSIIRIVNLDSSVTLFEFLSASFGSQYFKKRYDPVETELVNWEGKLAHIDLSTLSFIYKVNRDTYTMEDYLTLTYPLSVKQRWLSRETGLRVYVLGQVVRETGTTNVGFWDTLTKEIGVEGFDKISLSFTGSRHVSHSAISNLVDVLAQCIYKKTVNSLTNSPYDDYSAFAALGKADFEYFSFSGKQLALALCGYSDSISYSESQCDSMLSSFNSDYSTDLVNGPVIDRVVEIHDQLKVFYASRSPYPRTIGVMEAFNLVSSYDRPILIANYGYALKSWRYNLGAKMGGQYDSDYFSFGGSGSSQHRIEDYPIGKEWLFSEWYKAIETQIGRQLVVSPLGYFAIYRKQPLLNVPVPDDLVYYDEGSGIKYSTFEPVTDLVVSHTPYNASYNQDNTPESSDFYYETIDCIGVVGHEKTYTHQQFYEQAFSKSDGSIDDPETIISISEVYDPYYTAKKYLINRHVGSVYRSFYEDYNFLNMPRLNGSALITKY